MSQASDATTKVLEEQGLLARRLRLLVPAALIAALLGAVYLHYSYLRYERYAMDDAVQMVEMAELLLDRQIKGQVWNGLVNTEEPAYQALRRTLMQFREENPQVRFIYLFFEQDGKYYIFMDSEPEDSEDYSPYGQEYVTSTDGVRRAFAQRETIVDGAQTDRWGTWVSALTPVLGEDGEILAVLGMDYPADQWRAGLMERMRPDFIIVGSVVLLGIALCWMLLERGRLARLSRRLALDEALFRTVIDQAPMGIIISAPGVEGLGEAFSGSRFNRMFRRIVDRSEEELNALGWRDITHPEDVDISRQLHERLKRGEIDRFAFVKRYTRPDGIDVWVNAKAVRVDAPGAGSYAVALIEDITARKQAEDALSESERSKAVLLSHLPGLAYRCRPDRVWTMEFVSEGCQTLTGYPPEAFLGNRDISFNDLIAPEYHTIQWDEWQRVLSLRESFRHEYEIITRNGERRWVLELGQGIYREDGTVEALEGIVIDISSQKENESRLLYVSEHDPMTGLYNRRFYERIRRERDDPKYLPLSVAVCDIDGLHLVNDVFGLSEGDRLITQTAQLLTQCARPGDILIRSGGDEFTLIMPRTPASEAEAISRRINRAVSAFNENLPHPDYEMSLSVGVSTRMSMDIGFVQTVQSAQENMHYHKLLESRSPHNSILSSVMATMLARSRETEAHGERLVSLSRRMGEALGLEQKEMDELALYAMLHDIGKVGVDDRILNKPGRLNDEEWEQMKKHSEIGYRIAASASELSHVADYILSHHEQWDGLGYPRGLAGDQIPLLSRLLAIVDAYDAMTEDRVYRRAMTSDDALEEIRRGAGSQFDPDLAARFIRLVQG